MTGADIPLELLVGAQVRALRQALGMTLAELATAASLSTGMLSKIENGQTSPSLATLQALAGALNMPLGSFFETFDQKREATFVKSGEGLTIERRGSAKGHKYQLLGHGVRSPVQVEPFLITLDEGSDAYPIFRHEGVEFLYMLKGEITYAHGESTYVLTPGDSLFFDSGATHGPLELRDLHCIVSTVTEEIFID
ncbi:MAG: helix-turn-helix domain-containing protein [Pseudomonadota bacterium]